MFAMNQSNPPRGVSVLIILSITVLLIGLFQSEFKSYLIPVLSSLIILFLLEKVLLSFFNNNCLRVIQNLLLLSQKNKDVLSKGDRETKKYYIALNDPRVYEQLNYVLQAGNTQLLFDEAFLVKLLKASRILLVTTLVLLIVLIITKNSLIVWIVYLIWVVPPLMIGFQMLSKRKMFRLFILQMQYARDNKLSKVIYIAKKVSRITKRTSGIKSPDYAICQHNLGGIYKLLNDYRAAEDAFEKSFDIWSKINIKSELYYIQSLYELANIYFTNSKFNKAEKHFLELLDIVKDDDRFVINIMMKLSLLKLIQEDIEEVKKYNKQIEPRIIKCYGQDSDEYFHFQDSKSIVEMKEGNLREAQTFRSKDLEESLREKLQGEPLAKFLQNRGVDYLAANNYEKAEEYFKESYEIRLEYWGENHLALAESKMNLGYLYSARLEFNKGEKLMREALKIRENCYGTLNNEVAKSYAELGNCLTNKGDYDEAKICIQKALDIYEKLFSNSHPMYLNTMYNLGCLYDEMGDQKMAESIINDVYVKTLKILGNEHPLLKIDRFQIASFKVRNEMYKEALDLYKQTKSLDDKIIEETFFFGGEQQKLSIMDKIFYDVDKIFSFIVKYLPTDSDAISFGMDLILQRKGLVADIITSQNKLYKPNSDALSEGLLQELTDLKRELSQLQLQGFETLSVSEYKNSFDKYNKSIKELEETVSQNITSDLYNIIFKNDIRELVSSKLEANDVLIEFMKFKRFKFIANKYADDEYFALLQFSNDPDNIRCISLGSADTIDTLIKDVLANILSNCELDKSVSNDLMKPLKSLSSILLQPILRNIDSCDRLYLVPDGELFRLPFEALLTDDGKFAIEKYQIVYLNSGRDLVSKHGGRDESNFTESAIIANPDFNLGEKPTNKKNKKEFTRLGLKLAKDLPWTQDEADNLSKILKVKPITQQDASKKRILELTSPKYLHFATHGIFMPKETGLENLGTLLLGSENLSYHQLSTIQNPMLRSGLVLAGFNAWLSFKEVPEEMGNGFLTAMDIAQMDLTGTRLVVLSACESGLGDIDNGEGVFGLRRAFKIAGARRLVMSLWEVEDKETQQLMTDFYSCLHEDNITFYEAFRKTQLKFIHETSRNPYFWAAFIFLGVDN